MTASINRVRTERSADREKSLVKVRFTPQGPNPAQQTPVEAVFEYQDLDGYVEDKLPLALIPLSCTTCDTREPYRMSKPMRNAVLQAAMEKIAEEG